MTKIVTLVDDLYEDLELWYPVIRMREAGIEVKIAGANHSEMYKGKHGYPCEPDLDILHVKAEEFDGILIPGGSAPDKLKEIPEVIKLMQAFDQSKKMIAFICHGGLVPAKANILSGKKVTGTKSIKEEIAGVGGIWEDREIVVDGHLISSRTPKDLPAFGKAIVDYLC